MRTLPIYCALLSGNGNTPTKRWRKYLKANKPWLPRWDTVTYNLLSSVYLSKKNIVPNPLIRTVLEIIIALVFFPDFYQLGSFILLGLFPRTWEMMYCTCREKQKLMQSPEDESKEKRGVWDRTPELTVTSPYVHSRVDSNTFTSGQPYMPESTSNLFQSRLNSPVMDFGFCLSTELLSYS